LQQVLQAALSTIVIATGCLVGGGPGARAVTSFSSYIVRAKPNGTKLIDGRAGRRLEFELVGSSLFALLFTYHPQGERSVRIEINNS
jgi:hypothetical protein